MKLQKIMQKVMEHEQNKKYIIIFLFCGIILMVLPFPKTELSEDNSVKGYSFSLEKEELRLESIISSINGVSKCNVLLSVSTGTEVVFAETDGKMVLISEGNEKKPVTVLERYPGYQGAVVVIGGYSDANVRYDVLSAVMSYTGLNHDRITICPMEE